MIHCTEIGGMAASPGIAQEMGEWFDRNVLLPSGIFGEVKSSLCAHSGNTLTISGGLEFGFVSWGEE
jgi:hypothetical protein